MSTEKLMVAATITPAAVGEAIEKLPPHMTVLPWFDILANRWGDLDDEMRDIVIETAMPVAISGDSDLYGNDRSERVRKLNRPAVSFNLINGFDIHARVFSAVRRLGGEFDGTYTGLGWSPHITDTSEYRLDEGVAVSFDNLTIFAKNALHTQKSVKAIYRWENTNE